MNGFIKGIAPILLATACTALAVPATASANTTAEACYGQLADLDQARVTLDELQATVTGAEADRDRLKTRDAELSFTLSTASATDRNRIESERARVRGELATIAKILPPIKAQADALATEVDQAERAYISCIEQTL
jgi:hypothetical protein